MARLTPSGRAATTPEQHRALLDTVDDPHARRVAALDAELPTMVMRPLVNRAAPGLISMYGSLRRRAKLLIAAGDNPERLRCEPLRASAELPRSSLISNRRHRLNRAATGGQQALYHIVITRMPPINDQDYVARESRSKSTGEIARILKRYVAREAFKHLRRATPRSNRSTTCA